MTAAATAATTSSATPAQACRLRASAVSRPIQTPWLSTSVPGATASSRGARPPSSVAGVGQPHLRSPPAAAATGARRRCRARAAAGPRVRRRSARGPRDAGRAAQQRHHRARAGSPGRPAAGASPRGTCTVSDAPAPSRQCRASEAAPTAPASARAARKAIAATRNGSIRSDSARRRPSSSKPAGRSRRAAAAERGAASQALTSRP